MAAHGWKQLLVNNRWFRGVGKYPISAYSEFMPPPRLGRKPCDTVDSLLFSETDDWGWHVTEYEQAFELAPGLEQVAVQLLHALRHLGRGEPGHGISKHKLEGNPYWPPQLCEAGAPAQERYVILAPLALSRTQDDKGRVRWTLMGGSEQGPAKPFWRSFFLSPGQERPEAECLDFFRRLLKAAYGESSRRVSNLHEAGFRILPCDGDLPFDCWSEEPLPSWVSQYVLRPRESIDEVRYLLTFRPFLNLPAKVRRAYLAGRLHLLPFPGSLVFWGVQGMQKLQSELPLAMQIPLLHSIERHAAPHGLRVPQSGWMHEPHAELPEHDSNRGPLRNCYKRTHRWARVHRYDDELEVTPHEDRVAHVLFSTAADDLGLYGKPMARNAQLWTRDDRLLLDGPTANRADLARAARTVSAGGSFGYRFLFPAMRVGQHEVYWHRPLIAYFDKDAQPVVCHDGPLGYLTAYRAKRPDLNNPIELWPRLLDRPEHRLAISAFDRERDKHYRRTTTNLRKLLDSHRLLGRGPLERSFARQLVTLSRGLPLEDWLKSLSTKTADAEGARQLAKEVVACLASPLKSDVALSDGLPKSLTFRRTARRSFEAAYWKTISTLATGRYINKDNADCVRDAPTQARLVHPQRDLDALGDYLLSYYKRLLIRQSVPGAWIGELPFHWRTDFEFRWSGGWLDNQQNKLHERDLVVMIPGRDRSRTIVMADHYDTAYMEDEFGYGHGGHGPRLAAAGADDNHSATAALMLAAPIFMELSRAGRLRAMYGWFISRVKSSHPTAWVHAIFANKRSKVSFVCATCEVDSEKCRTCRSPAYTCRT